MIIQDHSQDHSETSYKRLQIFGQKRPLTYKSYRQVLFISIRYYLSFVYIGYILIYLHIVQSQQIIRIYSISFPKRYSLVVFVAILYLGSSLGALVESLMIGIISKNYNFILFNTVSIVGGFLILVPNMNMLFVGRFLQGICVGCFSSLAPTVVKQFVPIQISGSIGLNNIAIIVGILLAFGVKQLSNLIMNDFAQKYLIIFSIPLLINFLQLYILILKFPAQSAKSYLCNNKFEQAQHIISLIYKPEYQTKILQQKINQLSIKAHSSSQYIVNSKNQQILQNEKVQTIQKEKNTSLYKPKNYKKSTWLTIITSTFLVLLQSIIKFILIYFYITNFSCKLFSIKQHRYSEMVAGGTLVLSILIMFLLFNRMGRKSLIIFGVILCTLCHYYLLYGIYKIRFSQKNGEIYILYGILSLNTIFLTIVQPVTTIYLTQTLQPPTFALITFIKWIFNFVLIVIFFIIIEFNQGNDGAEIYLSCFFIQIGSIVLLFYLMIQTKDKNQVEIDQFLEKKSQKFVEYIVKCHWFIRFQYRIHRS